MNRLVWRELVVVGDCHLDRFLIDCRFVHEVGPKKGGEFEH